MGKGKSSSTQRVIVEQPKSVEQDPVVTPAVARSIARDTESAQANLMQARQRLFGLSSTYNRYKSGMDAGNFTLGGV